MATLDEIKFVTGLAAGQNEQAQASRLSRDRKAAAQKAIQAYSQGDLTGAIGSLAEVDPTIIQGPFSALMQNQGQANLIDTPERARDLAQAQNLPTFQFEATEEGGITGFDRTGQTAPIQTGLTPPQETGLGKPLAPSIIEQFSQSEAATQGLENLSTTMSNLIGEGQVGPISGRIESVKKVLGIADPTSDEFQSFKKFLALGLAAEQNRGRPTEPDMKAADVLIGDLRKNPSAAFNTLVQTIGSAKANRARLFLNNYTNATPGQKRRIEEIAQNQGINLQKEQLIRNLSKKSKLGEIKFRRNLELIKAAEQNPQLEIFQDPQIENSLRTTIEFLTENNIPLDEVM